MSAGRFGEVLVAAVSVPWNAFVGAFLYFTVLTAVVIGGADFSRLVMAVAYLLPVSLYASLLVSRGLHALSAITIDIDHAPHAVIR
jgi:predicted benzoate:H+ symporter BenE